MKPGDRYGSLTVIEIIKGAKELHPLVLCVCDCGNTRKPRKTSLARGRAQSCKNCAIKKAWVSRERKPKNPYVGKYGYYRNNAKRKNNSFDITLIEFTNLVRSPCIYCGQQPSNGIDRMHNQIGYTKANSFPCCSTCNYAKRGMSIQQFEDWITRLIRRRQENGFIL